MLSAVDRNSPCTFCLAGGMVLLVFSNGILGVVPAATWLAPVFLLRFLRTQRPLVGFALFVPLHVVAWIVMLYGILPDLGIIGNAFGFFYGLVFLLPYVVDRVLSPRLGGFLSTLAFPSAVVTAEYLLSIWDFTGSWFALAYTQHDNLPLVQLVSITGLPGVAFLIAWFASVANWIWQKDFAFPAVWKGGALYAGVFVLVHLFGGAYMAFAPADAPTVRVASVTRSFDMDVEAAKCRGDEDCLRQLFQRSLTEFLSDSERAVANGARIVMWQENGIAVYAADENSFFDAAREFALHKGVYLVMGVKVVAEDDPDDQNKAVVISPTGDMSEYLKNYRTPGDAHVLGDGTVQVWPSEYGRLGTIICKDFEYPAFVRQAGMAGVDIMLIPSHNWEAIDRYHARMAHFRAIENGYSMISATYHGTSTAVDFHGNLRGQMNDFTTEERILFADVPTRGMRTIYAVIGDAFSWLCGLALIGLILAGLRNIANVRGPGSAV